MQQVSQPDEWETTHANNAPNFFYLKRRREVGRLDGLDGHWAALKTAFAMGADGKDGGDNAVAQLLMRRFSNRSLSKVGVGKG